MAITEVRSTSTIAKSTTNSGYELESRPTASAVSTSASAQLLPLAVGQEVQAEVVETLAEGLVLVNIDGAVLTAAAEDLPMGQPFSARVEQLQPQVVLKALVGTQEEAGALSSRQMQAEAVKLLRAEIPHHSAMGEALAALARELTSFAEHPPQSSVPPSLEKLQNFIEKLLPEQAAPAAEHLAAFIRDSGLQYEAKLLHALAEQPEAWAQVAENDLKGLVLQALQDLPTNASTKMVETLALHLEHIESQQAVNLLAQTRGEAFQLQIPFFTGQQMTTAYLAIEPDGGQAGGQGNEGKGEKGKGCNLLFALDLEHFGRTRIDAHIGSTSLRAAFYVDQAESVALLRQELPEFHGVLQSLGYSEVLLVAKPLKQLAPEKQEKFTALTTGVSPSVHLLDVKA
jgi:hypothetical protein